jgi:nucleobase:cation symporter-1, NCS1 family
MDTNPASPGGGTAQRPDSDRPWSIETNGINPISENTFFAPFEGFLVTLGVLLAAWSGIFLADMALLRWRAGYDEARLYRAGPQAGYNLCGLAALLIAGAVGLGTVTSTSAVFSWVGYLLGLVGGRTGAVGGSSIGVIIALLLGGLVYTVLVAVSGRMAKARAARRQAVQAPA